MTVAVERIIKYNDHIQMFARSTKYVVPVECNSDKYVLTNSYYLDTFSLFGHEISQSINHHWNRMSKAIGIAFNSEIIVCALNIPYLPYWRGY